jgi:hypothetical protein
MAIDIRKQDGYIALMTVLIVGAVSVAVACAVLLAGADNQRSVYVLQRSLQARASAHTCAEEALQVIHDTTTYTGTGNLTLGNGMSCSYTVTNTGGNNRTITTVATVNSVVKRLLITATIGSTNIAVTSWKEVDSGSISTPAFVQVVSATPQSSPTSVAAAYAAQTAGNTNVVAIGFDNTTSNIVSVTDTAGNTYLPAAPLTRGTGLSQAIYYAKNINGGTPTVTVTFDSAAPFPDLRIMEYSGLDTSTPLDTSASAVGLNNPSNSGNLATSATTSLVVAAGFIQNSFTAPGSGYTQRIITSPNGDIVEDQVVTTAGTYGATATASGNWVFQAVAFRAAGQ